MDQTCNKSERINTDRPMTPAARALLHIRTAAGVSYRRSAGAACSRGYAEGQGGKAVASAGATPAAVSAAQEAEKVALINNRGRLGLFPWENFGAYDEKVPLTWWQKAYWVGFGCTFTWFIGERLYNYQTTGHWNTPASKPAAKAPPKPILLKSRVNAAIRGEAFTGDNDPFDGLSPTEIAALIAREAPEGDAFVGMTPDEIMLYVREEEEERAEIRKLSEEYEAATASK